MTDDNRAVGQARGNQMSRVEEYVFCVYQGSMAALPSPDDMLSRDKVGAVGNETSVSWENLIRRGTSARRIDRANQFFP